MSNSEADLYTRLGKIEGKIDSIIGLERRVASIEGKQNFLFGGIALASFVMGLVVKMM